MIVMDVVDLGGGGAPPHVSDRLTIGEDVPGDNTAVVRIQIKHDNF
jgi:hypothetical protein